MELLLRVSHVAGWIRERRSELTEQEGTVGRLCAVMSVATARRIAVYLYMIVDWKYKNFRRA